MSSDVPRLLSGSNVLTTLLASTRKIAGFEGSGDMVCPSVAATPRLATIETVAAPAAWPRNFRREIPRARSDGFIRCFISTSPLNETQASLRAHFVSPSRGVHRDLCAEGALPGEKATPDVFDLGIQQTEKCFP